MHLYVCFVQQGEWSAEKAFLDQQVCLLEQQSQERVSRLEESITSLQTERQMLQDRVVCSASHFQSLTPRDVVYSVLTNTFPFCVLG